MAGPSMQSKRHHQNTEADELLTIIAAEASRKSRGQWNVGCTLWQHLYLGDGQPLGRVCDQDPSDQVLALL